MITKSLVPFMKAETPTIDLSVTVDRRGDFLILQYEMTGAIESILMAEREYPTRQMGLWETTCFECFFGVPGQDWYWEVNLSAAGHWNVFKLDGYRSRLREELAIEELTILIDRSAFSLEIQFDLSLLGLENSELELSVTAVMADKLDEISYWAVCHAGVEADFHLRDSFVIGV
ncbi:MAG: DOMON-like domain-containing protein [Cyanobacteria bacterium]|nr:DOMON-like domain-containing protein [Cyanobacteriota bacterium]